MCKCATTQVVEADFAMHKNVLLCRTLVILYTGPYFMNSTEKVYFESQILVHEYLTIEDHFFFFFFFFFLRSSVVCSWLTLTHSKELKYRIFRQYWYVRNVPVFTNTGTYQYLGPKVHTFSNSANVHWLYCNSFVGSTWLSFWETLDSGQG